MGKIFGRLAEIESENPILWTVEIKKVPEIQEAENMGKTAISRRNDSSAYLDWLVPAAITMSPRIGTPLSAGHMPALDCLKWLVGKGHAHLASKVKGGQ